MSVRDLLPALIAILGLCLPGVVSAAGLRLGFGQEIGRDGHLTSEGRSDSDVYSETSFRVGLDHPVVFFDNRATFDPIVGISYIKYLEMTSLDAVGFDISGPLSLQLEGVGDESDVLRLSAGVNRDSGAVSTWNTDVATSTTVGANGLYTRHWGSPRWKSELGYRYAQRFYDDALYQDRDSITHTLSGAMLYGVTRELSVGARTGYAMEDFSGGRYLSSDIWDVAALLRWQVTGKVESELALGHETAFYQGGGSESGLMVRGALDYDVTPRWQCLASLTHHLEPADLPGRIGVTTTEGRVQVSYRFTPKLTGSLTPGAKRLTGDYEATEVSLAAEATYAFPWVDLTLQAGVTDRTSDLSDDDSYFAVDTALRLVWISGHEAGRRRDLRRLGRRH